MRYCHVQVGSESTSLLLFRLVRVFTTHCVSLTQFVSRLILMRSGLKLDSVFFKIDLSYVLSHLNMHELMSYFCLKSIEF